jgi:hypothetical protein
MADSGEGIPESSEPVKLTLVSGTVGYGPMPAPGEEVEQRVTLRANGRASVTRYVQPRRRGKERSEMARPQCSAEEAQAILDATLAALDREVVVCVTDVPVWELVLELEDGSAIDARGSVFPGDDVLDRISEALRKALGAPWLIAFDGCPDYYDCEEDDE